MATNFAPVAPPYQNPIPPTNYDLIMGEAIDDIVRVRGWDEDRFERYIHEWAYTLQLSGAYGKVVWAPGSGDKGRDIRAYVTDETGIWDNFQCKFYKNPLSPSDVWLELAKLCLYTLRGDFTKPRKYHFVAPHDLGPELSGLIGQGVKIRNLLLDEWAKTGKSSIAKKLVPLDPQIKAHVEAYDFDTITYLQQRDVIEAIKPTEYFRRVFGCRGLIRPKPEPLPESPAPVETNYVQELLAAFAEHLKIDSLAMTEDVLKKRPDLAAYLKVSRTCFYRAEGLYRFGRDTFPTSHCFEDLQEQVYVGILGVANDPHADGYAKVRAVTTEAGKQELGNHFLVGLKLVEVQDRQGICHQIVNSKDGRLEWVVKSKERVNG
jgi:hypothetical protein